MSAHSATPRPVAPRVAWHRPLLWLAVVMAVSAVASLVGMLVDPRDLTGAPVWAKPFKFSVSVLIYSVTLSWLLGLLRRWRRVSWWAGTVTAVFLSVEMVIIIGLAAVGMTSHFNVSTPFSAAVWSVMASSIVIVWTAALPVAILLFRADIGDPARSLAIRAGIVIALVGMALAFLMTSPTADQLADFRGIAGAHTVGASDGGPGLPLLGWSTVAGDLRIPHFVGMHALQAIPLLALTLELAARHVRTLGNAAVRLGLVRVGVGLYAGVLALLTGQALAGPSIVRPGALVVGVALALVASAALASAAVLRRGHGTDAASTELTGAAHR